MNIDPVQKGGKVQRVTWGPFEGPLTGQHGRRCHHRRPRVLGGAVAVDGGAIMKPNPKKEKRALVSYLVIFAPFTPYAT